MAFLSYFIGSLFSAFLLSRLCLFLMKKTTPLSRRRNLFIAHAITLGIAAIIWGWGQEKSILDGLLTYLPAVALLLVIDIIRSRKNTS